MMRFQTSGNWDGFVSQGLVARVGLTPKTLLDLGSWLFNLGIVTHRRADTWTFRQVCVLTFFDGLTIEWTNSLRQSQILWPPLTGNSEYEA